MIQLVFDTETTHLMLPAEADIKDQPWIVEIALIKLDAKYKRIGKLNTLVRPGIPIDEMEHERITKLTNEDLKGAPTFLEVLPELTAFCLGAEKIFAHNAPFDMSILVIELTRLNAQFAFPYPPQQICTVELNVPKYGKRMRLVDLYKDMTGKEFDQKHRALGDAEALETLIRKAKW